MVEIQEPSPRLLISRLAFGAVSPLLLDRRGELAARLSAEFDLPEWNAQPDTLQLFSKDTRRLFQVSIRDAYISTENFEELEEERSWAKGIISAALEALEVREIVSTGTRMHWLSAADSFSGLAEWFTERAGPLAAVAMSGIGRAPSDAAIVLEFKENPHIMLRLGPMNAEQAMNQFFRDKDPSHYPDDFLFLDIDQVHTDEGLNTRDALSRWNERVDKLAAMGAEMATSMISS